MLFFFGDKFPKRTKRSWKGLTKAVNRAGTGLMQRVGQVDRTVDSEFQAEEARYRTLEKSTLGLQKEAKNYLDSIRGERRDQDVKTDFDVSLELLLNLVSLLTLWPVHTYISSLKPTISNDCCSGKTRRNNRFFLYRLKRFRNVGSFI